MEIAAQELPTSSRASGPPGHRSTAVRPRAFERFLVHLSSTLVTSPADRVDVEIGAAVRALVEHLGVDRCAVCECSPDNDRLVVTHCFAVPGVPPATRELAEALFGCAAVRGGDVVRWSRLPDDLPSDALRARAHCERVGLRSTLLVPLRAAGSVEGALELASFRSYRDWPATLLPRMRLVGDILAGALARKRAAEALREGDVALRQARAGYRKLAAELLHAQEKERRRIAREMHDDWAQRLALLCLDLGKLEAHLGAPDRAGPLLGAVREQLMHLSEDVHALSRQLHPSILDDLGLVEALRSECAGFSRREGIAVAYHPGAVPAAVPKDVALCVYRVAQEALRNVAKHAGVKEAMVTLGTAGAELVLRVEDSGAGFDPTAVRTEPGLGLASMEERVRLVQARLTIASAPGRGTTVEVRVPV
jgi:signal transduction histidine kinase